MSVEGYAAVCFVVTLPCHHLKWNTTQRIERNGKSISEVVIQTQGGLPVWHSWPGLTSCFSSALPDMDGQMYILWHFVSLIKDKIELFRQIKWKIKRFSVAWKYGILFVSCGLSACEKMCLYRTIHNVQCNSKCFRANASHSSFLKFVLWSGFGWWPCLGFCLKMRLQ